MITFETFNEQGRHLAKIIERELGNVSHESLPDAVIYIGALGICVRKIKDIINDKYTDPAVICIDTTGKYIIPVLSGHIGGANTLARHIARITGGEAVITTQSDNTGLWALDTLARDNGWGIVKQSRIQMNKAIAAFVNREKTALVLDWNDEGTKHLIETCPEHVTIYNTLADYRKAERQGNDFALVIFVSSQNNIANIKNHKISIIQYVPLCLHLGIGCQKFAPVEIAEQMLSEIRVAGYLPEAIATIGTIELKKDEPLLKRISELLPNAKILIHKAEELAKIKIPNPSQKVFEVTGCYGVAESSAKAADKHGKLVIEKQKGKIDIDGKISHYTFALSDSTLADKSRAHIEIVGAGPGDPELISVRGKRFLEQADLILYAGSLVPRELTYYAKPGAVVRSSASMDLDDQFAIMKKYYDRGKLIVRLHTGDPCIYGAIQEQMAFFDKHDMDYHITPGISSFLAAAAELRSQFTIPERCQTIILTRGEGRTPMPDKEKLHMLAEHQSTMCIFLSASLAEQVQNELLEGGYPPETPIAACHKLTWKDQRIYRGQLKDLAKIMKDNNLTLTTMIVVGEAIDNREGLSKLYDGKFTHIFRKAKD